MKKVPKQKINFALTATVVCVLFIFLLVANALVDFISNKPEIRNYCRQTVQFISLNQAHLETILTTLFDDARNCSGDPKCEKRVSEAIFSQLNGKDTIFYFESTYFIRLKADQTIEKLFLSGRYTDSTQPQAKEDKVIRLLRGKRGRICDEGWKIDGDEVNTTSTGSRMRYLYDLFSEAEIIYPVKKDGVVIGAVVKAWGD